MKHGMVIAAVDLGPDTEMVIRAAAAERQPGDQLVIAHCLPDLQAVRPLFPERGGEDLIRTLGLEDAVRSHLTDLIARLGLENASLALMSGQPYAAVTQLATEQRAALIVTGGPENPRAWFAGTALRIARHADCPVLVHRATGAGPVLAATDLSDASLPALAAASALASRRGAQLVALHVIDVDRTMQSLALIASVAAANISLPHDKSTLHRIASVALGSAIQSKAPSASAELLWGPPEEIVVQRARDLDASMIVVATRGRTGLDRVLVGSVAENVIRAAPCSVLVARHSDPR